MLQILAAFALGSAALAGDPAPAAPATPAAPAAAAIPGVQDCSKLEGDAKSSCESANVVAEINAKIAALGDCAVKEGDAKASCETEKKALEAQLATAPAVAAPPADAKGGKAQRSNTNRMEAESSDE